MSHFSKATFLCFMMMCIAGFCAMGVWQVKRLHWKESLIARIDAVYAHDIAPPFVTADKIAALEKDRFIRGMFRGRLDFPNAFQLAGQIDAEKSTRHTIVPYILSKDATILVDFGPGFKLADKHNANTVLTGLLRNIPASNKFTPDNSPDSKTFFALDRGDLNIKNLKPFELLPEHTPWKDYPPRKPELRNEHLHYAMFWFAMAAITAAMSAYYLIKSRADN